MILMINKFKEILSWNSYNMVKRKENKIWKKRLRLDFSA